MTKHDAHRLIDSGIVTWGHLKTMIRCEMGAPAQRSAVNTGMTHAQSVDILARAADTRDDEEIVCGRISRTPRSTLSDRLIAVNILRECADSLPRDLSGLAGGA